MPILVKTVQQKQTLYMKICAGFFALMQPNSCIRHEIYYQGKMFQTKVGEEE
jgi:hypothetical protein